VISRADDATGQERGVDAPWRIAIGVLLTFVVWAVLFAANNLGVVLVALLALAGIVAAAGRRMRWGGRTVIVSTLALAVVFVVWDLAVLATGMERWIVEFRVVVQVFMLIVNGLVWAAALAIANRRRAEPRSSINWP
jgi:hypothetical protein